MSVIDLATASPEVRDAMLETCLVSFRNWFASYRRTKLTLKKALQFWWIQQGPLNVVMGSKQLVLQHIEEHFSGK